MPTILHGLDSRGKVSRKIVTAGFHQAEAVIVLQHHFVDLASLGFVLFFHGHRIRGDKVVFMAHPAIGQKVGWRPGGRLPGVQGS